MTAAFCERNDVVFCQTSFRALPTIVTTMVIRGLYLSPLSLSKVVNRGIQFAGSPSFNMLYDTIRIGFKPSCDRFFVLFGMRFNPSSMRRNFTVAICPITHTTFAILFIAMLLMILLRFKQDSRLIVQMVLLAFIKNALAVGYVPIMLGLTLCGWIFEWHMTRLTTRENLGKIAEGPSAAGWLDRPLAQGCAPHFRKGQIIPQLVL